MSEVEKKEWAHVHGSEKMIQMQCPYGDCGRPFLYDARTADDFPNGKMGYAYIKQLPVPLKYNEIKEKLDTEIKNHGELYLKFLKLKSDLDSAQGKLKKAIDRLKKMSCENKDILGGSGFNKRHAPNCRRCELIKELEAK